MSADPKTLDIGWWRLLLLLPVRGLLMWIYIPVAVLLWPFARVVSGQRPSLRRWVVYVDWWVFRSTLRLLGVTLPRPTLAGADGRFRFEDFY